MNVPRHANAYVQMGAAEDTKEVEKPRLASGRPGCLYKTYMYIYIHTYVCVNVYTCVYMYTPSTPNPTPNPKPILNPTRF